MKRYFFNVLYEDDAVQDEHGDVMPNDAAAANEADKVARELLVLAIQTNSATVPVGIAVSDLEGNIVHVLAINSIVPKPLHNLAAITKALGPLGDVLKSTMLVMAADTAVRPRGEG